MMDPHGIPPEPLFTRVLRPGLYRLHERVPNPVVKGSPILWRRRAWFEPGVYQIRQVGEHGDVAVCPVTRPGKAWRQPQDPLTTSLVVWEQHQDEVTSWNRLMLALKMHGEMTSPQTWVELQAMRGYDPAHDEGISADIVQSLLDCGLVTLDQIDVLLPPEEESS